MATCCMDVVFAALMLSFHYLNFTIKKASFVTSDGTSSTFYDNTVHKEETFINSSIFSSIFARKEIFVK